ncbi:hypothetical protein A9996_15190 [Gelidibacter algens]|nr:hypothetical protein A9996_15190 [Gelidibacter algens]
MGTRIYDANVFKLMNRKISIVIVFFNLVLFRKRKKSSVYRYPYIFNLPWKGKQKLSLDKML